MNHYTFEFDKVAQEFCVITLFGNYKHKHLPMGLICIIDFLSKSWSRYSVPLKPLEFTIMA